MYWRRVNGQASSFERLVAESKQVSVFFSQHYGLKFCFAWNLPNFNVCWFPLVFFGLISSTERTDICFEWHIQLAEGMLTLCFDNKTVIFLNLSSTFTHCIFVSQRLTFLRCKWSVVLCSKNMLPDGDEYKKLISTEAYIWVLMMVSSMV